MKIKSILKSLFNILGVEVTKRRLHYQNENMTAGIKRHAHRNLPDITTVIDAGAAQGTWSMAALAFWANANYVLFEPLLERKGELEQLVSEHKNFSLVQAAVGRDPGSIFFSVSSDLDGSAVTTDTSTENPNVREVRCTSIQHEIKRLGLPGPYVVKLDTHGYEVPIIEGCSMILDQVALFIIECYGFQITKDSLLFWEMCSFMEKKGFRLIDVVDIIRRDKDKAFWQCDAFFIPATHECFKSNTYL